tara:strand:- start:511 stop:702 length:192 start_codon:yes stop_codon:yes gene_type:complete
MIMNLVEVVRWRLIRDRKAVALDYLFWLIVGLIVLVIGVSAIAILTGKGQGAVEYIKDLFKWS